MEESTPSQPVQNAYVLDWWLIVTRTLSTRSRGRGIVSIPYWLGDLCNLTDYVAFEPTDEDECLIKPTDKTGVSTTADGRNKSSLQLSIPEPTLTALPVETDDRVALEFDLRDPGSGGTLRQVDEFDTERIRSLPPAIILDTLSTWNTGSSE